MDTTPDGVTDILPHDAIAARFGVLLDRVPNITDPLTGAALLDPARSAS
jgi:hypothetical protein